MSIPDYSSYSTVNSSSNNIDTVINTKNNKNNNSKRYFKSDSDSYTENFQLNNMRQNTIPKKSTILHYTIDNTSDSNSITSVSDISNEYKNSDMSYIPSSDDDSKSIPLNKSKKHRGNINHSKKYIQPKNNNTTGTELHTKIKNSSSRNKKIIISRRTIIHKTNNQNKIEQHQKSKNLVISNRTKKDKRRNSNNSNINNKNNNSTDNNHNDGSYGINRINNNNEIRREKQYRKEKEYNEKILDTFNQSNPG